MFTGQFIVRVVKIEEKFERRWVHGVADKAEFKDVSLGWFVTYEGSHESLHAGSTKPNLKVGDRVLITQEKLD